MPYPLTFDPIHKQKLWGMESWDVSYRPGETSVVSNGIHKGKTLEQLIALDAEGLLGTKFTGCQTFPFLVKIIKTDENLSVQVHPNDDYAQRVEHSAFGKSEMWVVLDAPEGARLILGVKQGITRSEFAHAIESGVVESCLNKVPAKRGDVFNIPAGLIHALTKGMVVAEVQQNSDITYRVYDYNRPGLSGESRELHVEKAMEVIDIDLPAEKVTGTRRKINGNIWADCTANDMFSLMSIEIKGHLTEESDLERFSIFTCIDGSCHVYGGIGRVSIRRGDTFFIPAALGRYTVEGKCMLLKTFMR